MTILSYSKFSSLIGRNFNNSTLFLLTKYSKTFKKISNLSTYNGDIISPETINQNIRLVDYAIRGPLFVRAQQLDTELKAGIIKPFKNIIRVDIGDYHSTDNGLQRSLTFCRQVLACAFDRRLLSSDNRLVPNDVKDKVSRLLDACGGRSIGSYSDSCGIELIRREIANYIEQRDKVDCDWENVFLSNGSSEAVKSILSFINNPRRLNCRVGVMTPIPQHPLYSTTLCEYNMQQVNYYLDENNDWSLTLQELKRAYNEQSNKCDIRALVVINPNNPTGSLLSKENIVEICHFAQQHGLLLLADEVYQQNIYDENLQFYSFKKILANLCDKSPQLFKSVPLASLMSGSKGFMNECGVRGGYCEIFNFPSQVRSLLYKFLSTLSCSSVLGQFVISCIVSPPNPGDDSYQLYIAERDQIISELKQKLKLVSETFNSIDGISSNTIAGSMYAFPRLQLSELTQQAARNINQAPDFFYSMNLLEQTGICVVPGSMLGQLSNTHHFRTTILPPIDTFHDMLDRFRKFHHQFMSHYS